MDIGDTGVLTGQFQVNDLVFKEGNIELAPSNCKDLFYQLLLMYEHILGVGLINHLYHLHFVCTYPILSLHPKKTWHGPYLSSWSMVATSCNKYGKSLS